MTGKRGQWHGIVFALTALTAACGGGGGEGPGIVATPVVISVVVPPPTSSSIDITETVQLSANVEVQNGASQQVDWTSGSPNVATVSPSGLVTGVSPGQASITATSTVNRSKSGSVLITVNPPRVVGVTLNSGARSVRVGENFTVTANVETRGTLARTVTFSSSGPTVASVTSADNLTATIAGVSAGAATITATSTADPGKSVNILVTVTGTVRITNVTPSPVNIRRGTNVKLVPTVQADPGISANVNYTSQNTTIATVANDGTVSGVGLGQTGIVVRSEGDPNVSVTVPVTVRSGVNSVTLTPERDSVRRGTTKQLSVTVSAEAGVPLTVNSSSADPTIATIDLTGKVTGVANGQTFVRVASAVDPAVIDSSLITVLDPCASYTPLVPSLLTSGTVNDQSCNGLAELYSLNVTQPMSFAMSATPTFPIEFTVLGDKSGRWFATADANATATAVVAVTPNRYFLRIAAQSVSQRGQFTIVAVPNAPLIGCQVVATTGLTMNAALSACSFVPAGRPAGNYNSVQFLMLPVLQPNAQITVSVTAPAGIFPVIAVQFGSAAPVQVIATGTTITQVFTAPATASFTRVTVSTRDAAQTGTVNVTITGPPSISFDAFVFGSGVLQSPGSSVGLAESLFSRP